MSSIKKKLKNKIRSYIFGWKHYKKEYALMGISRMEIIRLFQLSNLKKGVVSTTLYNHPIHTFNNYFWYLHSIDELFIEEVYKCRFNTDTPVILDCGANIGLSVIYFKKLFPKARVTAFEPDNNLYNNILFNIDSFKLSDVEVVNKGVWKESTTLHFSAGGTLGGTIVENNSNLSNLISIETVRLREYLNTKIDFLKIDIEGAEYEVIKDIKDLLVNVDNLFLEYHSEGNSPQVLHVMLQWIQEAGFKYHIKNAWENQKYPFIEKGHPIFDMQLNIFCYRV